VKPAVSRFAVRRFTADLGQFLLPEVGIAGHPVRQAIDAIDVRVIQLPLGRWVPFEDPAD